jgi:hypothetical protein
MHTPPPRLAGLPMREIDARRVVAFRGELLASALAARPTQTCRGGHAWSERLTASGVPVARYHPSGTWPQPIVFLRRRGAECVGDDLLDVAAFAFRALGQAVERPAVDGTVTLTAMSWSPGVTWTSALGHVVHHDGSAGLPVEGGLGRSGVPRRHYVPSAVVVVSRSTTVDHPAIRRRADDVTTALGTRIRVRRPDDLIGSEERQHILLAQSALGDLPEGSRLNSSERNGTGEIGRCRSDEETFHGRGGFRTCDLSRVKSTPLAARC